MGQSLKGGAASNSTFRPSSQISKRVPTAAPLSIASALPLSGIQKQGVQLLESNADLSNPDTLRMAGDIFGRNTSGSPNKYTAYGAASGSPFDYNNVTDDLTTSGPEPASAPEPATAPEPAPAPAPAPVPTNTYGFTPTAAPPGAPAGEYFTSRGGYHNQEVSNPFTVVGKDRYGEPIRQYYSAPGSRRPGS
jgi:hypothetical protein